MEQLFFARKLRKLIEVPRTITFANYLIQIHGIGQRLPQFEMLQYQHNVNITKQKRPSQILTGRACARPLTKRSMSSNGIERASSSPRCRTMIAADTNTL
jgi:hypothetical protein